MSLSLSFYLNSEKRRAATIRSALESENTQSSREEMGVASAERPSGILIWFQAPTVAKAIVLTKLIRQLGEDWQTVSFLLTTPKGGTSSFATDVLPPRCIHQFTPAPAEEFVEKFLSHWTPDIAVFVGLEDSPTSLLHVSKRAMPIVLIDVKLEKMSFGNLKGRVTGKRAAFRELISRIEFVDVVDAVSAKAVSSLGFPEDKLRISGPMDEVSATLPCNEEDRIALSKLLVGRPIWLASNIPVEEDNIVLNAHMAASRTAHRLLLILVPDLSLRGPELAAKFAEKGVRVRLRSLGELPDDETQIYLADTLEERGLWFRLATVSFLGSSLAAGNTVQSPFEAAGLGSAIIHGPNLGAHRTAFEALDHEGRARQVSGTKELSAALLTLLAPDKSAAMAHSAWDLTTKGARATDFALTRLETMLEELGAY